jgi:hypothetical protein
MRRPTQAKMRFTQWATERSPAVSLGHDLRYGKTPENWLPFRLFESLTESHESPPPHPRTQTLSIQDNV